MGKEAVWKVGETMRSIQSSLQRILRTVDHHPNTYLDKEHLEGVGVNAQKWSLADTDEYFACMSQESFADLTPKDTIEDCLVPYEATEHPKSAYPRNIWELEECASEITQWFQELQRRKASIDGHGFLWECGPSSWIPHNKLAFEDLYDGSRMPPNVPWYLCKAYHSEGQPHHIYHAWHGDEGTEGAILRSEIHILARCMKGRMAGSRLCVHNVPVLLVSAHGCKARIMIAHFNVNTMQLDIKYSALEQFNGFRQETDEPGHLTDGHPRPPDFEAKRDLFFRWLNPVCQGYTFLEDSKNAPEWVLRGRRGRKRLVPRASASKSPPVSDSSESID